jgi:hypothetical protein
MGWVAHAQTYQFKIKDPILCFDYNSNQLIVIEDSSYQISISLKTKKSKKRPLYWDEELSFQSLRALYIPLSTKGSPIYFVDGGCGWVCELRNDSVVRIDKSFHQQNQYGGAFFLHHGEPHIFGGYGLFSYKNFITRFDQNLNQWYLFDDHFNGASVTHEPFWVTEHSLDLLAPSARIPGAPLQEWWSFSFNDRQWKKRGSIGPINGLSYQKGWNRWENLFYDSNTLFEINFEEKKVYRYPITPTNALLSVRKWQGYYGLLRILENSPSASSILELIPIQPFQQRYPPKTFAFQESILNAQPLSFLGKPWALVFVVLILVLSVLIIRFIIGRKKEVQLTASTKALLDLWLGKDGYVLELSEMNDLVNSDQPSVDTLKKRRENLLKQFGEELSTQYKIEPQEVYLAQPHPSDKRMRILILQSKVIQKLKIRE